MLTTRLSNAQQRRDKLNNCLNALWNRPQFAQELFRLHQTAPIHRPAHAIGPHVAWGRGFFGETLLADAQKLQQTTCLVPGDRKEAALFGLAADALKASPRSTLLSIGGISSARTAGFAQIAALFRARFTLWEPDPLLIAKFLYEIEINALQPTLDVDIHPEFYLLRRQDKVPARASSSLRAYLQERGQYSAPFRFDFGEKTRQASDLTVGFAWIEPKGSSLRICARLIPTLAEGAIVALRLGVEDSEKTWQRLARLCRATKRVPFALPSGQVHTSNSIKRAAGAAWVALVPVAQISGVEV